MCIYLVVLYRARAGLRVSCLHVSIYPIFLKIMHSTYCNNFITQCIPLFHRSAVCGKLYFPISFTHCLILIFTCPLSCPLVLAPSL
ncbi:hypothetical protein E2C01_075618 [Portunus trituberculatus]|uniref:Uncharacterized protein n=1 Tax=Portunus trituberculatus TaxID=210409 RepID=A0A5B7IJL6_PORTR|nr:hypothetical protein [Portunus trituberculatus]